MVFVMEENPRLNIIDEIAKSSGYDIALMTTFNYDVGFFERAILNQLNAQNIKKVTVFVDSNELGKSISKVSSCNIGRRYMVSPIRIDGAFHPKLILLLGEDKAKLFVGSANVTTSGMTTNNEVFNVIRYSSKEPEFIDVINDAIDFFLEIHNISYQLDAGIIEEMKELPYYHRTNSNEEVKLIHNLNKPLLDQVKELIRDPVKEINIAVPYYDNTLAALGSIASMFNEARTVLYLQNGKSSFPKNKPLRDNTKTIVFNGFKDSQSNGCTNFYHGKVFLFKTDSAAYVMYGSANCTQAALTKTYEDRGNIECDLVGIGDIEEFDYFFQAIDIEKDADLETELLKYDTAMTSSYYYKFGRITDEGLFLHIGCSDVKKPEVTLNGEKLTCEMESGELIVAVPLELMFDLPDIFEIEIKLEGQHETMRCWTYSTEELTAYRQKQSERYQLETFEIDSEGDKFIQDRINIMNAETMCLPEIQEHEKKKAYINQIKQEQEENDTADEDFIVDVEILNEYKKAYRQLNLVERIRGSFFEKLMHTPISLLAYAREGKNTKSGHENNLHRTIRTATSDEKRFERFVKSRVKGMTNKIYIDVITPEHYLGIVSVVLDIFIKYRDVDIFDTEYVIETRSKLFVSLLKREKWENDSELNDMILRNCFYILMDNYLYSFRTDSMEEKDFLNRINRELLIAMEKRFSIRSNYQLLLDSMLGTKTETETIHGISKNNFYGYVENLFGYKNYDLLIQYIRTMYDNCEIKLLGDKLYIVGEADDIRKELKPNETLLREIRNFSREISPVKSVSIKIKPKVSGQNGSKIIEIEHIINFVLHNWRYTMLYSDGSRWSEKPEFISM